MSNRKKIRVGVIFGGQSGEHEVSLTSAQNVMDALDEEKYEVIPIGITKTGVWLTGSDSMDRLLAETQLPPKLAAAGSAEIATNYSLTGFLSRAIVPEVEDRGLDVVFPVLHGPKGEDGTIQGFFELADVPYVGCGVAASAMAMDKGIAKDIFRAHHLPLLPYQVIPRKWWQTKPDEVLNHLEGALDYPMFTKPARLGSSVGVSKASHREALAQGLDEAARYDSKLMVEYGPPVREIEISLMGNEEPIASVVGEIIPSREFYSYAAKYIDADSELIIPAPLTQEQAKQITGWAITAYKALNGSGLARADFFINRETEEIFLNEVNTMPGFTAISMYAKLWAASGIAYPELVDRLIELALERYAEQQASDSLFDVSQAE